MYGGVAVGDPSNPCPTLAKSGRGCGRNKEKKKKKKREMAQNIKEWH